MLTAMAPFVVMLSALCAWRLTVGISRPGASAVAKARRIADGGLSQDHAGTAVHAKDEPGRLPPFSIDIKRRNLVSTRVCAPPAHAVHKTADKRPRPETQKAWLDAS
jgi:hypothetical protein